MTYLPQRELKEGKEERRGEERGGAARRKDGSDREGGEKSGRCCRNREGWKEMGWQGCIVCVGFFFFLVVFLRGLAVQHLPASLLHMLYLPNLHRFELTEH